MSDKSWKCQWKGCKSTPDELHQMGYDIAGNKDERWFCEKHWRQWMERENPAILEHLDERGVK